MLRQALALETNVHKFWFRNVRGVVLATYVTREDLMKAKDHLLGMIRTTILEAHSEESRARLQEKLPHGLSAVYRKSPDSAKEYYRSTLKLQTKLRDRVLKIFGRMTQYYDQVNNFPGALSLN